VHRGCQTRPWLSHCQQCLLLLLLLLLLVLLQALLRLLSLHHTASNLTLCRSRMLMEEPAGNAGDE
jgi:hypothetical protein